MPVAFDHFLLLKQQLIELADVGVRLDDNLSASKVRRHLDQVEVELARRFNQGTAIDQALAEISSPRLQPVVNTLRYMLAAEKLPVALEHSRELHKARERSQRALSSGVVYPVIVALLAYAGLVAFCVFLLPHLVSTYDEMRIVPGRWTMFLIWIRETLAYWAWIPPLLLLGAAVWLHYRRGTSTIRDAVWRTRAKMADVLADLCGRHARPTSDQVQLASRISGLPGPSAATTLRPLIAWAAEHNAEGDDAALELASVATCYRHQSNVAAQRYGRAARVVPLVLLGGTLVLIYCLVLFVPMIELFTALSTEQAASPFPR